VGRFECAVVPEVLCHGLGVAADVLALRDWLHGLIDLPVGGTMVDLGCGGGEDLRRFAARRPDARCYGVDLSVAKDAVGIVRGNIGSGLPLAIESADVLYSVNAIECLVDKPAALRDWAKALRPEGQLVLAHFDWDTQTFDGVDRGLVRRVVQAYADWQQAWMPAIDPWAGRRLHRWARECGAFRGEMRAYTLINTVYEDPYYGWRQVRAFEGLVRRGMVSSEDYAVFRNEIERLAAEGSYFFSVTMFAFVGRRLSMP
jgi:SAM-dependent methyltransferase